MAQVKEAQKKTDSNLSLRVELRVPMLPNFLHTVEGHSIHISKVPDETLRKIGHEWTTKLIAHARKDKGIYDP